MALGDNYATSDQLKDYIGQAAADATNNTRISDALAASSRAIDKHCHRQFNLASSATARLYYADSQRLTSIDDFATTSGLVIKTDTDGDGTFETTWATTDYQLEPLNGVVDGEPGWPYWKIRAVASNLFPCVSADKRAPLQVTATWGWAAVPADVKQSCLILGASYFRLAGASFGLAGMDQFGPVRVKAMPQVAELLFPYVREPVLVG